MCSGGSQCKTVRHLGLSGKEGGGYRNLEGTTVQRTCGLWWSHYQRCHPSRKELGAKVSRSYLGCPLDSLPELEMARVMKGQGQVACW